MSLPIGSQVITSDIAVGTSGKKIRLYGLIVRATGTATVVTVYNGTSTSGVVMDIIDAASDTTTARMYAGGLLCNSGCFVDVDANTEFVTAIFEQENG